MKVRFAPSPTGFLHVGNARIALANALFAKRAGATFLLRHDDTDVARSRPEFAEAIPRDLGWLGIRWDEEFRQSDRIARYAAAADRLRASGRLYPCFENEEELRAKRELQLKRGQPPVYDRARGTLADRGRIRPMRGPGTGLKRPHWRPASLAVVVAAELVRSRARAQPSVEHVFAVAVGFCVHRGWCATRRHVPLYVHQRGGRWREQRQPVRLPRASGCHVDGGEDRRAADDRGCRLLGAHIPLRGGDFVDLPLSRFSDREGGKLSRHWPAYGCRRWREAPGAVMERLTGTRRLIWLTERNVVLF